MGRLFGTDGARGVANTEISCELAMKIGRFAAVVLGEGKENKPLRVLIGTDTRRSADMLSNAIASGFCSAGCNVLNIGVVPTPAVAFLVKQYNYDAGVVISASHNPFEYNGIKIFGPDGYKLPDETEEKIEAYILDDVSPVMPKVGSQVGTVTYSPTAVNDYIKHLGNAADAHFFGMRIAVDCANGAASKTAGELFGRLGAECTLIHCHPDGININADCGSMHLSRLCEYVRENGFDLGLAFDGDADRLLCSDENGNEVDGDKMIAICAKYLKEKGALKANTVAVTVMSNMGMLKYLEGNGIRYEKTAVGDRYVLQRMLETGCNLGGEQSGHIIFSDHATTGDGEMTAVQLLNIVRASGKTLGQLADEIELYPQILINVRVSALGKLRLDEDAEIRNAIAYAEEQLGDEGRVLVRASGTEPLVRVMLEGRDQKLTETLAQEIAQVVKERLI